MPRIAVLQMTTGIDPAVNAAVLVDAVSQAAQGGAVMLFTPEMSGLLDRDRARGGARIVDEHADPVLRSMREAAKEHGLWVALGSLAVRELVARYDKMHMFDVSLDTGETWQESRAYQPGEAPVVVETPLGRLGLTVCYDLRFPALFEQLGRAQCDVIAIPAAFTRPTGRDHWHVLQRARAIEASAFVVAAAQVGVHEDGRETYGHSLVIDPWGDVLLDMGGDGPGLAFAEINLERIATVRRQLPSLANRREIPKWDAS
jgi:deaminated glutathione amidase